MSKRARRRADRERMVARARRLFPNNHPGKYADNLTKCSCWMCCNPRHSIMNKHSERVTMQERRFAEMW